jgi:hypothetical protein
LNLPAKQFAQTAPAVEEYWPTAQVMQVEAPCALEDPTGQFAQEEDPVTF